MANIKFGTSGWRAVIAEDFTSQNLMTVAHAVAVHVKNNSDYGFNGDEYNRHLENSGKSMEKPLLVIGYDTRYLSEDFAKETAECFAADGIRVMLSKESAPTPAVAWAVMDNYASGGVTITASHNPPEYNGFKWTPFWGGPAIPAITDELELIIPNLSPTAAARKVAIEHAVISGMIEMSDFRPSYLNQVSSMLDLKQLKNSGLKVAVDSVYGTVKNYLRPYLEKTGISAIGLHEERDVMFGGRSPDTSEES